MAHLYVVSEWQGSSGNWYCDDIEDLGNDSAKWWIPARMLGMSLTDFILMLKDTFNATIVNYNAEKDFLFYYWTNQSDMRKYKNWINKMARNANFYI